jgi:hypothetical protein
MDGGRKEEGKNVRSFVLFKTKWSND